MAMEEDEISLSEKQEKMLEELCITNGVNYEKLKDGSGISVKRLEMFFSGFPEIVGMSYFPNLVTLCIVGQDTLEKIKGLESLVHLEELWICEANVQEICGLDNCGKLKRLYLYHNAISKINNLSLLKVLEVLWLNDNMIESIEGLDGLLNLKEINLSNNKVSQVGNSLEKLSRLEILHISGNQIRSLKDLNNFIQLRNLHTLSLKDPVYGANPVATVCNYSTYIFYHLPQIKRLDGHDVDNEAFKSLAMTTVKKKKMYYNMRVKTLERNMSNLLKQVEVEKTRLKKSPSARIRNLTNILKTLERELEVTFSSSSDDKNDVSTSDHYKDFQQLESYQHLMKAKLENFRDRVRELESVCDEIDQCYVESRGQVESISRSTVKRLLLELETGGNVRFEDGTTNDIWYTSCHDLVLSRFCASDFKAYDITGIKIHRITRVHNRVLRVAFDEKVTAFLAKNEEADCAYQKDVYASSIEYLFTCWTQTSNSNDGFLRLLDRGCYEEDSIRLSNNVFSSDCKRLEILKQQGEEQGDLCPYRHGQLVIAKVFVGDTESVKKEESKPSSNRHEANSTPVSCTASNGNVNSEFRTFTKLSDSSCDCHTKQCDWTVHDGDLVLPEYVVDFEYLTKIKPLSPLICYYGMTSYDVGDTPDDDVIDPDSDILDMEPLVQPRPRLLKITEDILLKHCSVESTKNITTLNLHDCGLARLKNINHLSNLKKLIVSFNSLTKLDDIISMPSLSSLDASFNCLTTLDGLKACPVLTGLDVSWNNLQHIRDEIGTLRRHVASLTSLNTRHNPWRRAGNYRTYTIGRIRTLQVLDGQYITEEEHALALRQAASSRITSFTILSRSRTDDDRLPSLCLASTATLLWKYSKNKPLVINEDDTSWVRTVTTLHLDGQGISKLSNLEKLTHLRWASFSENNINKIEGLETCTMLEELTLSRNCISKIDGLSKLTNLKRLDIAYNDITLLELNIMENLTNLEYLSVENNSIVSVQGLKKCTSLQELFAGNNQVSNTREIFYLKGLQRLDILDLSGNPMASTNDSHRLFVVYHLPFLKALNGIAVTSAERSCAKETLGGRMTMDFVAERLGHANFAELQEIDLPHCDLRTIDVGNGEVFRNLRSINLEHNNLTSFGGLIHLTNLRVLCLNYNKIESVFPKRKTTSPNSKKGPPVAHSSDDVTSPQSFTPVLEKLEVLHLGYNGISNLKALHLTRIPNMKALFLQGNEITKVEGIQGLQELRELVLDQNKIKSLSEVSFIGQRKLQELHMEDNRLRDLSHFEPLMNLQRLYLGMNKIQELSELQKLERMSSLFEISLISNPITRRLMHRPILVYRQPNILCIDGIPVTNDERAKAEVYLMDHQLASVVNSDGAEPNLPNLQTKQQAPLKVTTVQLSAASENGWSIGHRFGQVEYIENLTPHARNNDRHDPRAKLRASNSYPPQHIPSSYDVTRHGRHQLPASSSIHLSKPQGQMPNPSSYVLRGNSNSNFPQPPKPK